MQGAHCPSAALAAHTPPSPILETSKLSLLFIGKAMRVGDRDPLLQDAGMIANSNDFSETDFQDEEMSTGESDSGEDDLENVEMDDNSDAGSSGSLGSDGADNQIELEKKAEANYADLDSDTESKMNRIDAPSQPAPIRRSIAGPARPVSPSWPWSLLFPHRALHRDSHRLPYFAPDSRGRRAAASFRRLRTQPGAVSLPPNSIIPQTPITCLGHPQTQPQTLLLTPNPLVPQISTTFSLNLTTLPTPPSIPDTPANQQYGSKAISCLNAELYRKAQPKTVNYSLLLTYELTLVELITLCSRGLDVKPNLEHKCHILRSSLAKQLKRNLAALAGTPIGTSAATWMYTGPGRPNFIADTPLLYLTNGIVRHPQGEDRGLLSSAIDHALANGHWQVMLSEAECYVRHFNLGPVAPLATTADGIAMARFKQNYKAAHL
ncbi:hypothetical protein CFE70_003855 [Pyrenophora teres f. teres 0-1]